MLMRERPELIEKYDKYNEGVKEAIMKERAAAASSTVQSHSNSSGQDNLNKVNLLTNTSAINYDSNTNTVNNISNSINKSD